LLISLVVEE